MTPLEFVRTFAAKVPLRIVSVIGSGAAFAETDHALMLPVESGPPLRKFFVPKNVAQRAKLEVGSFVMGAWEEPGRRAWDKLKEAESDSGRLSHAERVDEAGFQAATHSLVVGLRLAGLGLDEDDEGFAVARAALAEVENSPAVAAAGSATIALVAMTAALLSKADRARHEALDRDAAAKAALLKLEQKYEEFQSGCAAFMADLEERQRALDDQFSAAAASFSLNTSPVRDQIMAAQEWLSRSSTRSADLDRALRTTFPATAALLEAERPQLRPGNESRHIVPSEIFARNEDDAKQSMQQRAVSLAAILSALTGSITLIHGSVGVGKTHSVGEAAELLDAQVDIIPVRPSWVEPADLLGYFDPMSRIFRPAAVSEAIRRRKNDEQLALLCLDELNLARIENYGADLLSRFEYSKRAVGDDVYLQLYSDAEYQGLAEEYESLSAVEHDRLTPEERRRRAVLARSLGAFPARMPLPRGLSLLGTLNADESTYEISPKVLDRSYCVQFPNPTIGEVATTRPRAGGNPTRGSLHISELMAAFQRTHSEQHQDIQAMLEGFLGATDLADFSDIGIPFGRRFANDFLAAAVAGRMCGWDDTSIVAFVSWTKVLPRITFRPNNRRKDIARRVLEFLDDRSECSEFAWTNTLAGIQTQLDDTAAPVVKYFRTLR